MYIELLVYFKSNSIMASIVIAKLNAVCLTAYFVQFAKLLVE